VTSVAEKNKRKKEMAKNKDENDISNLSFEEAIKELTAIVAKIEQGEIPLQDGLEQYEKGMALIKYCRGILQKAEKRIEKISKEEEPDNGAGKTEAG
jgi:exodeoxyribonuclease VII small subunit